MAILAFEGDSRNVGLVNADKSRFETMKTDKGYCCNRNRKFILTFNVKIISTINSPNIVFQVIGMKSNMNEERKVLLGNANNPIPNIIKPEMVKDAWNCAALTKVLTALGKFL